MYNDAQWLTYREGIILCQKDLAELCSERFFSPDYWQYQQAVTGVSTGRNTVWMIRFKNIEMVLRHYYRGGFFAKLNKDRFFFTSKENTRSVQEFLLLQKMYDLGLPVPKPIAAKVERKGIFYSADILIERIPNARDIFQVLKKEKISSHIWKKMGAMIAEFHNNAIYHSDLNCHNILWNGEEGLWLIDFDKCAIKSHSKKWPEKNIARLLRSFEKEKRLNQEFYWDSQDWDIFLNSYCQYRVKA